jgi:hypothetical protein
MRIINCAIRGAMLGGMVLALSAGPALASGENKMGNEMENEKGKVEINKVEKDKDEKVMLHEKIVKEKLGGLRVKELGIHRINLLDEDILGEEALEDILGEED